MYLHAYTYMRLHTQHALTSQVSRDKGRYQQRLKYIIGSQSGGIPDQAAIDEVVGAVPGFSNTQTGMRVCVCERVYEHVFSL
jgi:hypothetical protein